MNSTEKQHFVPRFYLKRFANAEKNVHIYNLKDKRFEKSKSYTAVGYEKYFYAQETGIPDELSQRVEEWLKVYEDIIAREVPTIIENILAMRQITEDNKYILAALMCLLWLRSPKMRSQMHTRSEDLIKEVMSFYAPQRVDSQAKRTGTNLTEEERKRFIKMLEEGNFDVKFNNVTHLKMMTESFGFQDKGFTNLFYAQNWKIYIAKGKKKFITSDSPVVEWWKPPDSFWGAGFLERNKYFALTPDIFVELTEPHGSKKVNRKTLFEDKDHKAHLFNILIAAHSNKYIYSGDEYLLGNLVEGIKNPGLVDLEYLRDYAFPWEEYRQRTKK